MSLYGALFSGVSGLKAQSTKLAAISDNISNVNTIGYKANQGIFQTLVTTSGGGTSYSPGGVLGGNRQLVSQQGLLQATNSPTDIAISGNGFFVVNQNDDSTGQVFYTRAGSFAQDANGNFRNTSGFFLQAWPLDREGRLPGEPGNSNTISSANLGSLRTVNVRNLTGVAAATTTVALGANLRASQTVFPGSGATVVMDDNDTINASNAANDIIIPQGSGSVDSLERGDAMDISIGGGGFSYTYGGFTFGRVVSSGAVGDSANAVIGGAGAGTTTLTQSAAAMPDNPFNITVSGADPTVRFTTSAAHGLAVGDVVTLANFGSTFNGVTAADLNDTFVITAVPTTTTFEVVVTGATATGTGATTNAESAATYTPDIFAMANSSTTVTVRHVDHGLADGETVTISGLTGGTIDGIDVDTYLNGTFVVNLVDDDHYEITIGTAADASAIGGSGTGTAVADIRPFSTTGYILDANTVTQSFLGTTGTSTFSASALSFTITTLSTGTSTFTYKASAPNAQSGEFNNLTNLAEAISSVDGLTARVSGGRLYVSAINATEAIAFANGAAGGTDGTTAGNAKYGIDWVRELGLDDVASASDRFSTMQGLADLVNSTTGLSASIESPLSDSELFINVDDPLDTVTFADDSGNTGSLVAALGLVDSLEGAAFSAQSTGALGPAYDPTDGDKNMAGGAIAPQFSRPIRIFDSLGEGHDLSVAFIKTGTNTWAAEVYAINATDVTTANGLLAYGTIVFNGDGSLRSITSLLSQDIDIAWTNGSEDSAISFNWGTAGVVGTGQTDGLSQFSSAYKVNFANQNGAQVGELTGVSIDENGFVTASYSNGETQQLFKLPMADFANPDALQSTSGNVFQQTGSSGEVNLAQAGSSGVGKFASSSLEASNVELADQLTDMIVAQRAYQANTKIIQTSASLLQELNDILR